MRYSCELIKDLLPLYYDGACSAPSRAAVEEHLAACPACRQTLAAMGEDLYSGQLQREREQVIAHYGDHLKKKAVLIGGCALLVPLLACLVVNIVTGHALDWFFIVLAAMAVFASLTAVPLLAVRKKGLWTLCGFTCSLLVLLLCCCLYAGGDWFWVAAVPVLFGLAAVFLPMVARQLPLRGAPARHRALLVMAVDTLLLYAVIAVCGAYSGAAGYWRPALLITTVCALFAWLLFLAIRYLPASGLTRAGICTAAVAVFGSTIQDVIFWILYGERELTLLQADLWHWHTDALVNANTYLLILLVGVAVGAALIAAGLLRRRTPKKR